MNPIDPAARTAQVVVASKRQACIDIYKLAVRNDEKEKEVAGKALDTACHLGIALIDAKQDVPHGGWTDALQEMGIPPEYARECIRFASIPPQTIAELGSKRMARRYLRELDKQNGGAPVLEEEDEAEPNEEKLVPSSDPLCERCQRVGRIQHCNGCAEVSENDRKKKQQEQKKGQVQQTFAFDEPDVSPDKAQERLEAGVRKTLREAAGEIRKVHTRLQQALRCGARTVDRLRQLAREAGFQIQKVTVQKASGFEDRGDDPTAYEDFQELTSIEKLFLKAATEDDSSTMSSAG